MGKKKKIKRTAKSVVGKVRTSKGDGLSAVVGKADFGTING